MKRKWTAAEVIHALRVAYGVANSALVTDEWSLLTEAPLRAPHGRHTEGFWSNTRRIDVLLCRNWTSGVGHRRIAVEVKVSRSDYRNEHDLKRLPAERAAHQTYYAAPASLIDPDTLPAGWGLIEVHPDGASWQAARGWALGGYGSLAKVRVRPAERDPVCDLDYLVAMGLRRASRAEERIRRGSDEAAQVPALLAEVERLTGQLERRNDALRREKARTRTLRDLAAAVEGGHVCSACEQPIALDARSRIGTAWKHRDPAQEQACQRARDEADRVAKQARTGTAYIRGWADPVLPKALAEQAADLTDA